jgi:hypothetical protein
VKKAPAARAASKTTRAFVDAVERGRARLLVGEEAFTVPVALLPRGAREGRWISLVVALAAPPADAADAEVRRRRLARDDDGGDLKL